MSDRHGPSTNARLQPGTQTHLDRPFRREDFHVAIICALALEYDAVSLAVDHFWDEGDGGDIFGRAVGDNNTYRTGRMGKHDVVLTLLPGMGKASAAASTANMKASFPNLRIALLVGVCGGVPIINISGEAPVEGANPNMLFLGDVVVSKMIIQYDFGRQYPGGFSHKSDRDAAAGAIRPLSKDVQNLLLCNLETEHGKSLLRRKTAEYLRSLQHMAVSREHERSYLFPGPARDKLFPNDYRHKHRLLDDSRCEACAAGTEAICERAIKTSCAELGCNEEMLVYRKSSQTSSAGLKRKRLHVQDSEGSLFPQIFTGCIASGDTVMKSGELRDQLAQKHGVIAFEMEGAGVWDEIPCLIVKGVCDYADSHKSKAWQPYAAATATAAAKAILEQLPVTDKPTAPSENQQREIQAGIVLRQLDQTIGRMDVETLLSWISGLPMKQHPFIFPILHTDPMFDWIFHNADYKTWTSSTPPGIFWISGPFRRVDPRLLVPSYIASIQATTVTTPSDVLSHLVCRPGHDGVRGIILSILKLSTSHMGPQARANVIKMLLHHLVQVAQQHVLQNGWGSRFAEGIREKQQISMLLLESPLELLTATFKEALGHEPLQSTLSILIDTFDNSEASGIDENLFRTLGSLAQWFSTAALNVRIVVTSPVFAGRERILKDVPVIMHDIERMECLRSLEFNNTRYDKITQQSRGSCEWIWQHCEYKAWRASDTSKVLYIQGKPGSGKSTLTKFFSSELASREHAVVANYFYSYREGEVQRSHRNMLRKILYDILNQDESFFYFHFQNEYRSRRQYGTVTEWDYEALKRILSSLSGHPHSKLIFMVIDAVDESDDEDRRIILGLLFELCASSCQCTFKIFIASRPVKQLDVRNKESYRFIRMQDQTKEDIERFARSFLQNLQISNIVEDAAEYIVDNAHGVFLWVSLIGKELLTWVEDGLSEEEIYECLTYLPTELQELYERMFRNLESTSRNPRDRLYRRRMIQLVLFSRRPLDVQELLHAIAIADNIDESFIPSKKSFIQRISTEHRVLSCAGNFLEIKMEKGKGIVQVIHQTVREFFLRPNGFFASSSSDSTGDHFGILNIMDANISIATACIRYLMLLCNMGHQELQASSEVTGWNQDAYRGFSQHLDSLPFGEYAFEYLPSHLEEIQRSSCNWTSSSMNRLISQFMAGIDHQALRYLLKGWLEYQNHSPETRQPAGLAESQQVCRGRQWLSSVCAWLFDEADTESLELRDRLEDSGTCTCLSLRTILEYQADIPEHEPNRQRTWSTMACDGSNEAEQLEEQVFHTCPPNSRGNQPLVPSTDKFRHRLLWEAAHEGLATAVAIVLDVWPNKTTNKVLECAALEAAKRGHLSTIKTFEEHRPGIYFSIRDDRGRSALHLAAQEGHIEVARAILHAPATPRKYKWRFINAPDEQSYTALRYAVVNNQVDMVRYLLSVDVSLDWDTLSPWGTSALHVAVMEANLETIEILLHSPKVNVNKRDNWGRTALHEAVRGQISQIVSLLLGKPEIEVNPHAGMAGVGTPLQTAYEVGDMETVLTLIKDPRVAVGDYLQWYQPRPRGDNIDICSMADNELDDVAEGEETMKMTEYHDIDLEIWQDGMESITPAETYRRSKAKAMVANLSRVLQKG